MTSSVPDPDPIRVLVVDDSSLVRRAVRQILEGEPGIEVADSAADGRIALEKIRRLQPDLVTLDMEMPEVDGLETLRQLREQRSRLPVIMLSTLTERGAKATLDALALGASDYVTKPSGTGSAESAAEHLRDQLVPKIRALGARHRASSGTGATVSSLRRGPGRAAAPRPAPEALAPATITPIRAGLGPRPGGPPAPVEVLAIGVSTGGPNALADLLPQLPANLPVPVLIVQHMPPTFTRMLAERLDGRSALRVREASEPEALEPGTVWLAPGGRHLVVRRNGAVTSTGIYDGPPENSCKPAVDVLFRAVSAVYGAGVLAVVLTGMGQDGLHGAEDIVSRGGRVLAQDEATSVVWGMPGAVVNAGLAEKVLPLPDLAAEIVGRLPARRGVR